MPVVRTGTVTNYWGPQFSLRSPHETTVALVVSGQMWRGAQVPLQVDKLVGTLEERGYRETTIFGSSSGALAALCGSIASSRRNLPAGQQEEQAKKDRAAIRELWHSFAQRTYRWSSIRDFVRGKGLPFAPATIDVFKGIDEGFKIGGQRGFQRIFDSPTTLVLAASRKTEKFLGAEPVYLMKEGSVPCNLPGKKVIKINNARELEEAAKASLWVPVFFTGFSTPFQGIELGGQTLFDGAWSDNTPVLAALVSGATTVFAFNDSQSGLIRQTEVQAQILRPCRKSFRAMARLSGWLKSIPGLRRIHEFFVSTERWAANLVDPVDIKRLLKEQYPQASVHVVGLPATYPVKRVGPQLERFLLPSLKLVDPILDSGDGQIPEILAVL